MKDWEWQNGYQAAREDNILHTSMSNELKIAAESKKHWFINRLLGFFLQLDCKKDHWKKTGRNAEGVSRAEVF